MLIFDSFCYALLWADEEFSNSKPPKKVLISSLYSSLLTEVQLILFAFLEQEKAPPKGFQNFPLFYF